MRFYFDYAASTPVDSRAKKAMDPYFSQKLGNPGSLHSFGQEAMAALDNSRQIITRAIAADFREIIFTGSATEANNLALQGSMRRFTQMIRGLTQINISDNQRKISEYLRPRLIISAIEHESVLETARDLGKEGVEVIFLAVNKEGIVDLNELRKSLNERTVLVSIMYANNEIGSIQPIAKISEIINEFKATRKTRIASELSQKKHSGHSNGFADLGRYPLFHTDAVQAFQFLNCNVNDLGVDLMTLSAHKIYGPKGVGALYLRSPKYEALNPKQIPSTNVPNHKRLGFGNSNLDIVSNFEFRNSNLQPLVKPIVFGGGQEFGLRSGTENIPLIVGFAKAVELIMKNKEKEAKRISGLRNYFWQGIKKIYHKAQINVDIGADKRGYSIRENQRGHHPRESAFLPNILNIYFPDYESDYLLTKFDLAGIAVSAGSACSSRSVEPSYIITALGYSKERAKKSLRFSFGRPTSKNQIDKSLKIIKLLLK